jgi:hypothetical protein
MRLNLRALSVVWWQVKDMIRNGDPKAWKALGAGSCAIVAHLNKVSEPSLKSLSLGHRLFPTIAPIVYTPCSYASAD